MVISKKTFLVAILAFILVSQSGCYWTFRKDVPSNWVPAKPLNCNLDGFTADSVIAAALLPISIGILVAASTMSDRCNGFICFPDRELAQGFGYALLIPACLFALSGASGVPGTLRCVQAREQREEWLLLDRQIKANGTGTGPAACRERA
ncbi:MAG: hypothetical protein JRJ87_20535 [Deltaproteobacteria bacterium]|nr:hypothetical protein [Deltaproteobacteria bacterium]